MWGLGGEDGIRGRNVRYNDHPPPTLYCDCQRRWHCQCRDRPPSAVARTAPVPYALLAPTHVSRVRTILNNVKDVKLNHETGKPHPQGHGAHQGFRPWKNMLHVEQLLLVTFSNDVVFADASPSPCLQRPPSYPHLYPAGPYETVFVFSYCPQVHFLIKKSVENFVTLSI